VDKQKLKQNLQRLGIAVTADNKVKKSDITSALSRRKLVAALINIIESGFKEAEVKFTRENEAGEVKEYLKKFKDASSKNKIKNQAEKNIDSWSKKYFKDFKKFVDNLEETKTKTEVKKLKKMEGAKHDVYNITTEDASCFYGSGTKWCTTQKDKKHFREYKSNGVNFYYCISKTLDQKDDLYKVAVAVYPGKEEEIFDAQDNSLSSIPDNIPTFKREYLIKPIMIDGKEYTEDISTWPLKIKGYLDLSGTKITITSLPADLKVGGDLNLVGTQITSLPNGLEVGGYLDLSGTQITSLPHGLKVGRDLILEGTKITSLPAGLKIGGYLYLPDGFDTSKVPEHLRSKLPQKIFSVSGMKRLT